MQRYIKRAKEAEIIEKMKHFPAVAILGPRQCGKSTLAKKIGQRIKNFLYLDLELPSELRKLSEPEIFFDANKEKVICLDEIQRVPEIFSVLRGVIDKKRKNGRFLILGSASSGLIRQTSESLAGRIAFIELSPFSFSEVFSLPKFSLKKFWLRGGYPESFLPVTDQVSQQWRENFLKALIERDIVQLGFSISARRLYLFLQICAHLQGQTINLQKIGQSLGISYNTVKRYIEIFEQIFIFRTLPPFFSNLKKRIVKSPKLYIRDSGLLHTILEIKSFNELLGHPIFGSSWEGFALENILNEAGNWRASFFRSSSGNEIDLILEKSNKKIAVEFKASVSPQLTKGFYLALKELKIKDAWVIAPIKDEYFADKNVRISGLAQFLNFLKSL